MLNIVKEKLELIPIIKDIDNLENILNKFKLGIVTTLVDTISNRP